MVQEVDERLPVPGEEERLRNAAAASGQRQPRLISSPSIRGARLVSSTGYANRSTMHCSNTKFWIARTLLAVMLVPAFGPLALAAQSHEGMRCARKPLDSSVATRPPAHCHEMAGMGAAGSSDVLASADSESASLVSFRALDSCCPNHDCCRGAVTSEWASPVALHVPSLSLLVESPPALRSDVGPSFLFAGPDSARAPPRV
jgi:hypothetical protein